MTQSNVSSAYGKFSASPRTTFADAVAGASPVSAIARRMVSTERSSDCIAVEGDDVGTAPIGLERMPAGAASDVDDLGGRPDTEPVEIDRQHALASTPCVRSPARRPARFERPRLPS